MTEAAWSAEALAALCRLWAEGVSTTEIGRRLGRSKNSVVGKAHRLNLPARPSPIRQDGAARPVLRRATPGLATSMGGGLVGDTLAALGIGLSPAVVTVEARAAAVVVAFAAVASRPCVWPMWGDRERPTQRFCAAAGIPGKPYCREHDARAHARAPAAAPAVPGSGFGWR